MAKYADLLVTVETKEKLKQIAKDKGMNLAELVKFLTDNVYDQLYSQNK